MNWNPGGVGAGQNLSICDPDLSALTWGFPAAGEIGPCSPEAAAGLSSSPLQFPVQSGSIWLKKKKIEQTLKCICRPDTLSERHFFFFLFFPMPGVLLCHPALQPLYILSLLHFLCLRGRNIPSEVSSLCNSLKLGIKSLLIVWFSLLNIAPQRLF